MWRFLLASSTSKNHLNRKSSSTPRYLQASNFRVSRRRCSSRLILLLSQELSLLVTVLMQQGHLSSRRVKFSLQELSDYGILLFPIP
uniref:Uncharacterized protein n=1 Tax=Hyaloperonospora arabidopsidis (strain Emoy2) TaxID=559515 RepID=M4C1K4_HYAAE